jgi:hypothetical protein
MRRKWQRMGNSAALRMASPVPDKIVFFERSRHRRWHTRRNCLVLKEMGHTEVIPMRVEEAAVRGYARQCTICMPVDLSARSS